MQYLLGIDNGGTYSKAAIFSTTGQQMGKGNARVPLFATQAGFRERDLEELWQANVEAIQQALANSNVAPKQIAGISFSGHGKGLYLLDKAGQNLGRGILSTDTRAEDIVHIWRENGTETAARVYTHQPCNACQPVTLLRWLKEYRSEIYVRIGAVLSVNDYLVYRLTGSIIAERTLASGSGFYDFSSDSFPPELLKLYGLEEIQSALPKLYVSTDIIGTLSAEAAKVTGLPAGTPVAAGMFDIDACGLASGMVTEAELAVIAGTWSINEYIASHLVEDEVSTRNSCFAIRGKFLVEESSPTSAGNLEWWLRTQLAEEKRQAESAGHSIYEITNAWVASINPARNPVVYFPFLNGSATSGKARGVFYGLTESTNRAQMTAALYEGVVFSHRRHLEKLLAHREAPQVIRLSGGAANSPVWVQLFADILQIPIVTITGKELGALGAAMAAGVAVGIYHDFVEAVKDCVAEGQKILPRTEMQSIYTSKYHQYVTLEDNLQKIWETS